jgi:hypothetical protein
MGELLCVRAGERSKNQAGRGNRGQIHEINEGLGMLTRAEAHRSITINSLVQKFIKYKLGSLNLAPNLGNVSRACKIMVVWACTKHITRYLSFEQ